MMAEALKVLKVYFWKYQFWKLGRKDFRQHYNYNKYLFW